MNLYKKKFFLVFVLLVTLNTTIHAQDSTKTNKWFIVLPLRFTQLQNHNTMLSGVKLGRAITDRINTSISIYHSFYLNSFKATANINTFEKQPRLLINCMGGEFEYYLLKKNKFSAGIQLLLGWGFMKYELKENSFRSKQLNYLVLEPSVNVEYRIISNCSIGLGIGYRPILSNKQITYTSDISNGQIPVHKQLPNGVNLIIALKGFL